MSVFTRTACLLGTVLAAALPVVAEAWALYGDRPHPAAYPEAGPDAPAPGDYPGAYAREYPGDYPMTDPSAFPGDFRGDYGGVYPGGDPRSYPGAYPGTYGGDSRGPYGGAYGRDFGSPDASPYGAPFGIPYGSGYPGMGPGSYAYPDVPPNTWPAAPPFIGHGRQSGPPPGVPRFASPDRGPRSEFRLSRRAADDAYLLDIELEGMAPEDVEVQSQGRWILISSDRAQQETQDDRFDHGYQRTYRYTSGIVRRRLSVPRDGDLGAMTRENRGNSIHIRIPRR